MSLLTVSRHGLVELFAAKNGELRHTGALQEFADVVTASVEIGLVHRTHFLDALSQGSQPLGTSLGSELVVALGDRLHQRVEP